MTKRKALGSGLEALLSTKPIVADQSRSMDSSDISSTKIISIPIHEITRNKNQPRQLFFNEALESIAESIKELGQQVPILVRQNDSGYELIAGERRWRAMQSIQAQNIDAIVMDVDDKESALIAIVENVQREQLNSIEEAEALEKLHTDYNMTHDDIAKYTGKSRSHITNILRLNDLVDYVKTKLQDGSIEMGHARAVLSLDSSLQETIIKNAVIKRLSVRAVEALARNSRVKNVKKSNDINQDTVALEKDLSEHLAADIKISHKSNGTGKLEIKYKSLNELQGIVAKFKK
ncbi:MAG: ParB/RepB/Spo0J family partition protein [Gammaproteobacteria bacterium]|jgi:ParB family transcriptional regulator, chromosome partitioning protein|nr:ParB/RepB/Spo0J family partition protein [Gammaproteobacteria bacterium]MBT4462325.1 ParB/RepB/Spo0J family partition protein [Gammaproteobacteria bacterium]MBT4655252.1 ParB/RepB/Spo0J family partition protein [Gammaproteobacteria bacterium]MBT5117035.1 ParB/RepB/Spo0J family partition protein [Gammaproteobacteria bacterium]MBT5762067.1 ParB/RepB/Spo0J family partition protein [Gammaproteobacteria bacterium]